MARASCRPSAPMLRRIEGHFRHRIQSPSRFISGRETMSAVQGPTLPDVGQVEFTVYGAGRGSRQCASRFRLRCDAIALGEDQILLLSVAGPETSVKALLAGLRSSTRDQN